MPSVVEPGRLRRDPNATLQRIAPRLARMTINTRLIAIVLTLVVPLNVVVAVVIWKLANAADQTQRTSLLYSARSIATAVDAELGKYIALGQVLSRDPALRDDSLDAFENELRQQLAPVPDVQALVADLDGRQLMNTGVPHGQPLPPRPAEGLAAQNRAFETNSVIISDAYIGPRSRNWVASANVPIFRDGKPFRSLALAMYAS